MSANYLEILEIITKPKFVTIIISKFDIDYKRNTSCSKVAQDIFLLLYNMPYLTQN